MSFPPAGTGPPHGEHALVERLRAGDETAYEQLVRQHGSAMLTLARRYLRQEDDARDAVQDAFASAFQAIHRFREGSSLATWLHRIVVNAALMKLRRRSSRGSEVSIDDVLPVFDEQGHHLAPIARWPVSAESLVLEKETIARVHACIERLPAQYREVLILRDIEELTTAETATVLSTSENAVKVRLHRARQALAALLGDVLSPPVRTTP